jgi:hypothetical protein
MKTALKICDKCLCSTCQNIDCKEMQCPYCNISEPVKICGGYRGEVKIG